MRKPKIHRSDDQQFVNGEAFLVKAMEEFFNWEKFLYIIINKTKIGQRIPEGSQVSLKEEEVRYANTKGGPVLKFKLRWRNDRKKRI